MIKELLLKASRGDSMVETKSHKVALQVLKNLGLPEDYRIKCQ